MIQNMDPYLTNLAADMNCLVSLDNFKEINIYSGDVPIILRNPFPFVVREFLDQDKCGWRIVLGASLMNRIRLENDYLVETIPFTCSSSKFLIGLNSDHYFSDDSLNHICIFINQAEYTFYSILFINHITVWRISASSRRPTLTPTRNTFYILTFSM